MRILVVHNYYGSESPSGENNAVDLEISMLRGFGHEIATFTRHSDAIRSRGWVGSVRGGLAVPWNPFAAADFKRALARFEPDVVHVHNTFPLISPAIVWAVGGRVPLVMTLHNYRLFCASATLLRQGRPCTRCLEERSVRSALIFGCYRDSRIATLPLAVGIALHRALGTWTAKVDAFITFSAFQRSTMIGAGLPAERVFIKPQLIGGDPAPVAWNERTRHAVYVGRLTPEKGVEHLIDAWIALGAAAPQLRVIGAGPLRATLERRVADAGLKGVEFLGAVPSDQATREIARARLALIPSIGYEGFPLVLLDALAYGTPCAVSNLGSLPTIVQHGQSGLVFEAGRSDAIVALIRSVWDDEALLAKVSAGARAAFLANYTDAMNHRRLIEIYDAAFGRRGAGPAPVLDVSGGGRKMRIVVVHNYYGSSAPSGENTVVNSEIKMMRDAGHEVLTFTRQSDEIRDAGALGLVHGGLAVMWNPFEAARLRRFLRAHRPDVVHVHNTFPLISPAIFWVIREFAACVLTLHNFRLFCANALLLRDGAVCTQCLDKASSWPAIRHGCYRQSRLATLPLAQSIALHRAVGTWRTQVDAFIALTEFQRDKLTAAGLPAPLLHVKPNFFSGVPRVVPWAERRDVAVFVGRLTVEKGVDLLISACVSLGDAAPPLRIVGEGPMRASLEQLARGRPGARIEFVGGVPGDRAIREISTAKLLIVPSIWFEGFPIVLQDAFAAGTPSAVANIGSLPTIVEDGTNGLVFEPSDSQAIARLLARVWGDDELLMRLSAGARARFESDYTEAINLRRLLDIYGQAVAHRHGGSSGITRGA
jgi:glycosyltransferase involved in cell wall biosynthesis